MELVRKKYQGVWNIIRFNRHFYIGTAVAFAVLIIIGNIFPAYINLIALCSIAAAIGILTSLAVSFYVYDHSDLYQLKWLDEIRNDASIVNINAGFDETSDLIRRKKPKAQLTICDFYDPEKHTEISIRRARKAYPENPETIRVSTDLLPFQYHAFDAVIVTFAAHEIRNASERTAFFKELHRILDTNGKVYITEHLRDINNFLAYTIGFLHFYSRNSWLETFRNSGFQIKSEITTTPFVTTFILSKNGNPL